MKSKKILATIVAFASFMAVATSGLAAVTTTTTYNTGTDKVSVNVNVTEASEGSEVTYLVKSGENIVYIDQQTADSKGTVSFDYKIAKDKIVGLATDVQFGTNGEAAIVGAEALQLANINVTAGANATIAFYTDANCENLISGAAIVGNGDTIYAKITVEDGYAVDTVTGLEASGSDIYKVTANDVAFTTKSTYVAPSVEVPELNFGDTVESDKVVEDEDGIMIKDADLSVDSDAGEVPEEAVQYVKVMKVVGQPKEVGVKYNGYKYPAIANGGVYESGKLYAVRIIVKQGVVIDTLPTYMDAQ